MNKLFITLLIISVFAVGILLIQSPQDLAQDSPSITLKEYQYCGQANYLFHHECQKSQGFKSTLAAFIELTYYLEKKCLPKCKQFRDYSYGSVYENPLHYNNYYADCYLAPQVQEVAKQDSCFYNTYYLIDYIKCAGL